MKKKIMVLLFGLLVLGLCACSGSEPKTAAEPEAEKEEVKLVTNGRLSALEAPEGWEQEETSDENELIYNYTNPDEEDAYPAQLWINIAEGSSADDMLEVAETRSKESEQNYTVEEKTFGDVTYSYFVPEFGSKTLYGTINDTTVCVSHDSDI